MNEIFHTFVVVVKSVTIIVDFILYSTPQLRLTTFQVFSRHMGQMVIIILDSADVEHFFLPLFFFFLRTVTWEIVIGDKEKTTVE